MIWGKLLGAAFGFALFHLPGALLGAWLGHHFDKGIAFNNFGFAADPEQAKRSFFSTLFKVMGHIAKADGRVTESEINMAKAIMSHMRLNEERRKAAIEYFNQGKQPEFNLTACLDEFLNDTGRAPNLIQMFIEIEIQAAFADGQLGSAERNILERIAREVGISTIQLNLLINSVQAQHRFHQSQQQSYSANPENTLADAYQVLCVDASASDSEVKKAYRKMMSQHHPDKLAAKGLPDDMLEVAKEKTQEIQSAWEVIRKHRELR